MEPEADRQEISRNAPCIRELLICEIVSFIGQILEGWQFSVLIRAFATH